MLRHKDIIDAFSGNDRARIEQILRDPVTSDLLYGFDSTARSLRIGGQRIEDRHSPRLTLDALVGLAEAVNARPVDLPENYSVGRKSIIDPNEVLQQIDKALGFEFHVHNPYPGEWGLLTDRGVISYRVPQALYQAWRVAKLLDGISNPKVLEIGGGVGRTALYARQFGILDYTIVDIPVSSLAQGYFLGRSLGDDAVSLSGEPLGQHRIKIISPREFFESNERYDIVINIDSLTEIGREAADAYWSQIKRRADRFLSINHEANDFTVGQLINGYKSTRSPYWLRRGFVEEVVELIKQR